MRTLWREISATRSEHGLLLECLPHRREDMPTVWRKVSASSSRCLLLAALRTAGKARRKESHQDKFIFG
jgi:hypothetical protein